MKVVSIVKPVLFIYECMKLLILAGLMILQGYVQTNFINVVFAVTSALYPLMALFLCLDAVRYRAYIPLFTAGKCIGIFTLAAYSFFSMHITMIGGLLLSGDLFTLAAILLIRKDVFSITEKTDENITNIHSQEKPELEEN